jgi:uncharacterized protein (DUF4415 family)
MKGSDMRTKHKKTTEEQLAALAALPDEQIDLSDAPELSDEQWANSVRGKFYKPVKRHLSVRIDADIVEWLKSHPSGGERGYQSRMNQILRAAMIESVKMNVSP